MPAPKLSTLHTLLVPHNNVCSRNYRHPHLISGEREAELVGGSRGKSIGERDVKELPRLMVGTGKSKLCRAGQGAGNSGRL